ncbi:MAG: hypothetical protein V2I33_20665, partial [Kangiellaceae bacterium]|nr:hypothetical protein [Kangiellaceae bacterium]
ADKSSDSDSEDNYSDDWDSDYSDDFEEYNSEDDVDISQAVQIFRSTINNENVEETSFCMSDSGLDLSRVDEESEEETPSASRQGPFGFNCEDSLTVSQTIDENTDPFHDLAGPNPGTYTMYDKHGAEPELEKITEAPPEHAPTGTRPEIEAQRQKCLQAMDAPIFEALYKFI